MTDTYDSDVHALLARRAEAQQSKDIDRLMSFYAPDIVYYDVVPPLRFTGLDEVRRNFRRWFDGYEGPITLETHDRTVVTDEAGGVAFAHMLHRDTGQRKGGLQPSVWVRETVCLRRSPQGVWSIVNEHVSVPVDPTTLTVWLPADKDEAGPGSDLHQ
ncbi:YybH family protein [Streptomyces sp. NPDC053493]|uniref:YybH family protein n=1 Tax=Streptomyces sp. NPDC053493 TaxID=3365705 RepID=UPI0037D80578